MRPLRNISLLTLCLLSACSTKLRPGQTPDTEPTIKTLASRTIVVNKDQGVVTSEAQAIKAYRSFLDTAPQAPQRAEAMRRIGDLEMDRLESAQTQGDPDFSAAIKSYKEFLAAYPNDPTNDRVLYQLARAQEQSGDVDAALATLNRLVANYPKTTYSDEAQFRLGEMLFATRNYPKAEKAYSIVLASGKSGRYYDRALYMRGWSQFKQGQLDEAVQSFFGVLDIKVAGRKGDGALDSIEGLTRADRELVEDTFRVISLSLSNMQGAESIATYINSPERQSYEWRVYEQLGELYLKQERVKDAADTFSLFVRQKPLDAQAPILQARVIEMYERNGFANLGLQAKKQYVVNYGRASEFRAANSEGWEKAQPLVKTNVADLATFYHASAQKSKSPADYQEAIHWYRDYLESFPTDAAASKNNFLLAELLFETEQYEQASKEYEKTAYGYDTFAQSADAGYAALLSYANQQKKAPEADVPALQRKTVESELRFAKNFDNDSRAMPVLADAADKLYTLKDAAQATAVAQMILDHQPAAPNEQRRVAWTILAYTEFEQGDFAHSEKAFGEVLALTAASKENTATRSELTERQAAAIYKQGEQARKEDHLAEAIKAFERVIDVAPNSSVRPTAQYDAAAAMIALKQWDSAAASLEDFRKRFPTNPLQADVGNKLAAVYLEKGQLDSAAAELEKIAATSKDNKTASDAYWQAAGLYEKAGARAPAEKAYERFLNLNRSDLLLSLEARAKLANLAKQDNNTNRYLAQMREIYQTDQLGGAARTDRTRYLGAVAALALAEPVADAFRKIPLVEPLKKQLKLKKAKMEEALKAYSVATDFGVAEISTEATFQIATIYRDFGKSLLDSERPAKLSKLEREQYNVLLEEQAFPFEEKAIEIHTVNAERSAAGIYDQWVKKSFEALRGLQPIRYGKTERSDVNAEAVKTPASDQAAALNVQGIAYRQKGDFKQAAKAYEDALALDANCANALVNQGILLDMYMGEPQRALESYNRYVALKPDAEVAKWIKELQNRISKSAAAKQEKKS